jgi:hypothetical protein
LIERVIADIAGRLPPSSGDNLTGFVIDADHFLGECDAFESVEVDRSTNPRSLLEIRAEVAVSVNTVQEISHALLDAWQSIAYTHFQASAVHFYKEATVLRFVTVISNDAFYVSGAVRVAGAHYPALVQRYDRDFGASHGPLPALRA